MRLFLIKKGADYKVSTFSLVCLGLSPAQNGRLINFNRKIEERVLFQGLRRARNRSLLSVNEDFEFKRNAEIASLFGFSYNLALIAFDSSS